jgi:hypothetical protein
VRTRLIVAALALAVIAGGCGGGDSAKRRAVAQYIDRVNVIEGRLVPPLREVTKADRDFVKHKAPPAAVRRRLLSARAVVRRVAGQLAALDPPAPARRLHALLVALVAREEELTGEVAQLVAFSPRFAAAIRPVGHAGLQLRTVLNSKAKPAVKAAALEQYRAALAPVLAQLRRLHPPPVSAPALRAQVDALARVRVTAEALANGLRRKQTRKIARLARAFGEAAISNQTLAAQRADRRAVQEYDRRVGTLNALGRAITREEARLEKTL